MKRCIALLALLALCSCASETETTEVPRPNLDGVEPAVVEAVEREIAIVGRDPQAANGWGQLGDRFRSQQWLQEAAVCYRMAETLEPNNFRWPHLLGKALHFDDPGGAEQAYQRALDLDPNYPPTHLLRAEVLARLGRAEAADRHRQTARQLDPKNPLPVLGMAQVDLEAGRLDEAAEGFDRALELFPGLGQAHLGLARIAHLRGDSATANEQAALGRRLNNPIGIPDPRAAINVEPVSSLGLARLGKELLQRGQFDQAIQILEEAVRRNPERVNPLVSLGLASMIRDDFVRAEELLRRAVALQPTDTEAQAGLGNLLFLAPGGRIAEAVEHLAESARLDPGNRDTQNRLGHGLTLLGRLDEAEVHLRRAIEIDPDFSSGRYRLAMLLRELNRSDEAVAELEQVIRINRTILAAPGPATPLPPGTPSRADRARQLLAESHNTLAEMRYAAGDSARAIEQLREALTQAPGWFLAGRNLAWILATSRDVSVRNGVEALELAQGAAQATQFQDARTLDALAAAMATTGDFAQARDTAARALQLAATSNQGGLAQGIRLRLRLYESGQPFRQN